MGHAGVPGLALGIDLIIDHRPVLHPRRCRQLAEIGQGAQQRLGHRASIAIPLTPGPRPSFLRQPAAFGRERISDEIGDRRLIERGDARRVGDRAAGALAASGEAARGQRGREIGGIRNPVAPDRERTAGIVDVETQHAGV